ncbi:MAG: hypothetical protein ACE37F_31465 [Nannocystaceae bacterium]|nr:hypothetical protein [bacterium]
MRTWAISSLVLLATSGCGGSSTPATSETDDSGTSLTTMSASETTPSSSDTPTSTTLDSASASSDGPTTTGTDTSGSGTASEGSGSSTGVANTSDTANDPENPLDCGGTVYACGNGVDDDMDGLVDLDDPECTGPCDDDEASFATGLPGDNMDCKQDCFFDGNSGQGDDGCIWNLRCDPENPGANIGCEYTGNNNCENESQASWDQECIDFCLPFVPPGCDCFGCCIVDTPEGEVSIFLNSDEDGECSLDNLEACESCTFNDNCGNPCDGECELCFGQDELPPECDTAECDFGDPCESVSDCPSDWYCLQGCCLPPPPG